MVNPGGPGESGVDFLIEAASRFTSLRASYNIVSFDPRGTGRSDPAHCLAAADLDQYFAADPIAETVAEPVQPGRSRAAFRDRVPRKDGPVTAVSRNAVHGSRPRGATPRDRRSEADIPGSQLWDVPRRDLRVALPGNVRAMVLDGVENPTIPLLRRRKTRPPRSSMISPISRPAAHGDAGSADRRAATIAQRARQPPRSSTDRQRTAIDARGGDHRHRHVSLRTRRGSKSRGGACQRDQRGSARQRRSPARLGGRLRRTQERRHVHSARSRPTSRLRARTARCPRRLRRTSPKHSA